MSATKVRRVSKEQVKENARQGGRGSSWFKLPKGVEQWAPEEVGKVVLDFLPYQVTSKNHPDKIEPGTLWYKHAFAVHHGVGANQESIVCPTTLGKACPMCQDRAKLAKGGDADEETLRALNAQKYMAYIIKHPEDEEKIAVFAMSRGKFADILEKELDETEDDVVLFWDVTDEGKTLTVRFGEEKFAGHKFLQASRIDFKDREAMDEDEILSKVPCLDDIFNVPEYDKLKAIYLQVEDEDDEDTKPKSKAKADDDDDPPAKPKKTAPKEDDDEKPAAKPTKTEVKAAKFSVGDAVNFEDKKGKARTGKITDIDDDDVTIEDKDGDEFIVDIDDITAAKVEKTEKPAAKAKDDDAKFTKGDKVVYTLKGKEHPGTVVEVDGDDVTVEDEEGVEHDIDIDDVKAAKASRAVKDEKPAKGKIEVGSNVTWDDGDASGEVVKIHSTNGKAKVKDKDDDEVWVDMDELTLAD